MWGVIARQTDGGFVGRYHHNCAEPHNLGKALYLLRNGHFQGDTAAMLRILIDEHPAGWSDIIGMDFSLTPGFLEPRPHLSWGQERRLPDFRQPRCYCHGDRCEEPVTFTEANTPMHVSFLYLINPTSHVMEISMYDWPHDGAPERRLGGSVALDGPAPSWRRYRSERIFYTKKEWKQLHLEMDEFDRYFDRFTDEDWARHMQETSVVEDDQDAASMAQDEAKRDPFVNS
jgi:hypothetical protein